MKQKERFLRMGEVIQRVGLSRSQIYKLISLNEFPAQIKLCCSISAWLESDIDDWIETKVRASKEAA